MVKVTCFAVARVEMATPPTITQTTLKRKRQKKLNTLPEHQQKSNSSFYIFQKFPPYYPLFSRRAENRTRSADIQNCDKASKSPWSSFRVQGARP
jgi:hypothetical protein